MTDIRQSTVRALARALWYVLGQGKEFDAAVARYDAMTEEQRKQWVDESIDQLQKLRQKERLPESNAQMAVHSFEAALIAEVKDGEMTREQARRICRRADEFYTVLEDARKRKADERAGNVAGGSEGTPAPSGN